MGSRTAIYSDEVDPGASLAHVHRRKSHVAYWSFLELGINALSCEDAWFCAFTQRSTENANVEGGLSAALAQLVHAMCTGEDNLPEGIQVYIRGTAIKIFARIRVSLQDGAAHKSTWCCKGDSGTRLCMLCKNVVAAKSELVAEDGSGLLRANVIYRGELVLSDDNDIRTTVRELSEASRHMSGDPWEDLQQARGWTHTPGNMLLDESLDQHVHPTQDFMHDWMHCLVVAGVFNTVVYLLFESMRAPHMYVHSPYELFQGFLVNFNWPKRISGSTNLHEIFSKARSRSHRAAKHLKAQASDCLSIYPVLALFIHTVVLPSGQCDDACNAALALFDVMDFIKSIPRGGIEPDMISAAVHSFMELFVKAWGVDKTHSKFHWLLHLADCLANIGILLSCFVHERRHRLIRKYAGDAYNTGTYEHTLLAEAVCHHLGNLESKDNFDFSVGIGNSRLCQPNMRKLILDQLGLLDHEAGPLYCSTSARFSALAQCKRRDIVLVSEANVHGFVAGEVWMNFSLNGETLSVVALFELLNFDSNVGVAEWEMPGTPTLIETCEILDTLIWDIPRDGVLRTILPCHFRV